MQNLSPIFSKNTPQEIFNGKIENFLICLKLAEHLREKVFDEDAGKFFEDAALKAIYRSLFSILKLSDLKLLLSEMPNILLLNYPAVEKLRGACITLLTQLKEKIRNSITRQEKMFMWKEFTEYDYLLRMLQTFKNYEHKK